MDKKIPKTPQEIILSAFKAGMHLTVKQAWRIAGTTELRKVVSRLRQKGYPIKSYYKKGEQFKHYYLEGNPLPAKGTKLETFNLPELDLDTEDKNSK